MSTLVHRYEHATDNKNSLKLDPEGEKIHAGLLKKLNELESDLTFKMGNFYLLSQLWTLEGHFLVESGLFLFGRRVHCRECPPP